MGADQNLIRAAAQLGPKPFDYSGIMTAIANIGKFMAVKKAVAEEVLGQGRKMFKAVPDEIFQGKYGEQNLEFITTKRNQYAAAYETMKTAFPGSKKYKDAVRTVNGIKSILEKNKAGLIKWEELREKAESGDLLNNMSSGNGSVSHNRVLDIINNSTTGNLNANIVFTDPGVLFYDDEMDMNVSIDDLMNGYKEKSPFLDDASRKIVGVIEKYAIKPAEGDKPLSMEEAKTEIDAILEEAGQTKNGGFNSVRSLAYDFYYGGDSYVTSKSDSILQLTNDEFVAEQTAIDPDVTRNEIKIMKQNLLADAYGTNNTQDLEDGLRKWLYGLVQQKYDNTEPVANQSSRSSVMLPIARRLYFEDEPRLASIMEGKESKDRTFNIDDITFDYVGGKWRSNYYKELGMTPVEGNDQDVKDGSGRALYNQLGQRKAFEFLLLPTYNK